MRAFTITGPGEGRLTERAMPVPGAGEVRVAVRTVGFCGSDLNTWRGLNPMVSYPRIPGHEVAGIIDAIGDGVPEPWRPGLAVTLSPYSHCSRCTACRQGRHYCCRHNQTLGVQRDGALCSHIVVPWEKLFTSPKLSLDELALVEPLTVGAHAAARGQVSAGETVAVFGCGAIGLGAIAAAAFRGARVIAIDIDDAKLAIARCAGAAETVNTAATDLHERLTALTDGDGPLVMIEAVGLPQTFRAAVEEVAFAGRVVYIGYAKQPVEYETKLFVQKELDIRGSRNATADDFRQVIAMLERKRFPVDAVLTRIVPLTEAADALTAWAANPAAITKILVSIPPEAGTC